MPDPQVCVILHVCVVHHQNDIIHRMDTQRSKNVSLMCKVKCVSLYVCTYLDNYSSPLRLSLEDVLFIESRNEKHCSI